MLAILFIKVKYLLLDQYIYIFFKPNEFFFFLWWWGRGGGVSVCVYVCFSPSIQLIDCNINNLLMLL